jgi:hypothetical protein
LFEKEYDLENVIKIDNIWERGKTEEESKLKIEKLNSIISKSGTDKLNAIIDFMNYINGEK